jgi:hypothetical protein
MNLSLNATREGFLIRRVIFCDNDVFKWKISLGGKQCGLHKERMEKEKQIQLIFIIWGQNKWICKDGGIRKSTRKSSVKRSHEPDNN